MAKPVSGGGGGGGNDYSKATDAKHLFDMIGKDVHETVEKEAANYRGKLHGRLTGATFHTRKGFVPSHVSEPCQLDHKIHTNVTSGYDNDNPCANRSTVRFSDKYGGQCTDTKIKGNDPANGGACAPFRRLFLCDHHLSHMNAGKTNTTDNLLLE
ncbi:hypothetical protein PFHG_05296, partial [Plasmodium falciparum HB3]